MNKDYIINFRAYSHGLLTTYSHTKKHCLNEFKRLSSLTSDIVNKELGSNEDISVDYIELENNKGNIVKTYFY